MLRLLRWELISLMTWEWIIFRKHKYSTFGMRWKVVCCLYDVHIIKQKFNTPPFNKKISKYFIHVQLQWYRLVGSFDYPLTLLGKED